MADRPRLIVDLRDFRPLWNVPDWAIAEIEAAAPRHLEVRVVNSVADGRGDGGGPSPESIDAIAGAEVYLGYGFPPELLESARRSGDTLRWVHSGAAGVRGTLHMGMLESSIQLTNSAGIHAEPIADTVTAMIHYFARGLDFAVAGQGRRTWDRTAFDSPHTPVREVAESTLGIVGFGGIGEAVARRALALGMTVLAHRRRPIPPPPGITLLPDKDGLAELLSTSHYVVLALPHTSATERLLDQGKIARLRSDAVVINVGRGDAIDEDELADALEAGRIRGAGLDVFVREPLPAESRLWEMPNVLITPHVSATTDRFWRRETDLIVENLGRYARGETLLNLVDRQAGY